jgi:hypothetical protein
MGLVFSGTPFPRLLESLDWRGVYKSLQNIEPQGFRSQDLENKGVIASFLLFLLFRVHRLRLDDDLGVPVPRGYQNQNPPSNVAKGATLEWGTLEIYLRHLFYQP